MNPSFIQQDTYRRIALVFAYILAYANITLMKKNKATVYDCFSSEVRVRMLECLQKTYSVNELLKQCDLSQSALSQHLKILKDAGLVTCSRDGTHQMYRVAHPRVSRIATTVRSLTDKS